MTESIKTKLSETQYNELCTLVDISKYVSIDILEDAPKQDHIVFRLISNKGHQLVVTLARD